MNGVRRIFVIVILIALAEFHTGQSSPQQPRYLNLYRQAEKLYYDDSTTDAEDSLALSYYLRVIDLHTGSPDSVVWDSHFKTGIFLQTAGKFREAIPYFQKAISMKDRVKAVPAQNFYLPNLYLGNSWYSLSMLDSAVHYYKNAEAIASAYPYLESVERLYNTLGAINYESGDYQQSRMYFEKALELLQKHQPNNTALTVNFKNNLASAYRQLKEYDKAMSMFNSLLAYNINRDEILHNIGSIYLEQGKDSLAIVYLKKVRYNNQNKLNDLGTAFERFDEEDSALAYFRQAVQLNQVVNGGRKNIQYAITCKNLGDHFVSMANYDSALIEYQQAIVQLVFDFNDDDVRTNPAEFNGQFSVIELFEALSAKAKTFTLRYQADHNKNDLLYSIFAYDALYRLADYVTRTYSSDEARMLLTNKKHLSHTEPIDNSLKLFEITGDSVYLRHAFRFDEKNKATLLAMQLQESGSKRSGVLPADLLMNEKVLKREITALQLAGSTGADSITAQRNEQKLRDKQIELAELQKRFDEQPGYRKLKFIDNTINLPDALKIVPDDYAVLTYHMGDTSLLSFLLTRNSFTYFNSKKDTMLAKDVKKLYTLCQVTDRNVTKEVDSLSRYLYDVLLKPYEPRLDAMDHLMIVPDDELSYLPFEILKNEHGKRLINDHSIAYNYSVSLLRTEGGRAVRLDNTLAMAPFIRSLPASEKEVSGIKGEKLIANAATKEAFISKAPSYSLIHLATHATANDADPSKSFIAFYSADTISSSGKLYTNEVANLALEKVKLVILSACETGAGQLVKGEGLMSITRSFSTAGCENTIASLWKADDASTAYITGRLHKYLADGQSAAQALKLAKLDYLEDSKVAARVKSPAYWAHLRLVGTFNESAHNNYLLIGIAIALLLITAALIYSQWLRHDAMRTRSRKKSLTSS